MLFWYLVLPFGRNPLHAQRGILCDRSFRPAFIMFIQFEEKVCEGEKNRKEETKFNDDSSSLNVISSTHVK